MTQSFPLRQTARAVLIDPEDRILLIQYQAARDLPGRAPGDRAFWYTPGGGLEPGESFEQAVARELGEEVGIHDAAIGALVGIWQGPIELFIKPTQQDARFFVVRRPHSLIDTTDLQATEVDPVLDVRWLTLAEMRELEDRIFPRGLVALAAILLSGQAPEKPVILGDLVGNVLGDAMT